jgi:hypothetical protein
MEDKDKRHQTEEISPGPVSTVTLTVPFPDTFVYSNASSFSMTMMDLKIGFGEAMPNRTVEARIGVTIPIEHAAHVALSLLTQLCAFEDNFGPVRHPHWNLVKDRIREVIQSAVPSLPEPHE